MARTRSTFSFFYNRITLSILAICVVLLSGTLWQLLQKEREALERKQEAQRELASLEEREELLAQELYVLDTPRGKEAFIRNARDVAHPGEEVIILLDAPEVATEEDESPGGLWGYITSIFR